MTRNLIAAFAVLGLAVSSAGAQTVKIGLIMPYSGQFADAATQMDNAIKLYVKEHGEIVAGRKPRFFPRETGAAPPAAPNRPPQGRVGADPLEIPPGFVPPPTPPPPPGIPPAPKKT